MLGLIIVFIIVFIIGLIVGIMGFNRIEILMLTTYLTDDELDIYCHLIDGIRDRIHDRMKGRNK